MGANMKHFKLLGTVLCAALALGVIAPSAFAETVNLPDISLTLGGAYPLVLTFADNSKTPTGFQSTSGGKLEGEGVALTLEVAALGSSGTYLGIFLKVKQSGMTACKTNGAGAEEVITKGKFSLVPLENTAALPLGILFEPEEATVECGATKIKLRGKVLSSLVKIQNEANELTEAGAVLEGDKKGKNDITEYVNDEGRKVKAILEANFGTGFFQADDSIMEEIAFKAMGGKMFVITNR
jgi:hypothetical protein